MVHTNLPPEMGIVQTTGGTKGERAGLFLFCPRLSLFGKVSASINRHHTYLLGVKKERENKTHKNTRKDNTTKTQNYKNTKNKNPKKKTNTQHTSTQN